MPIDRGQITAEFIGYYETLSFMRQMFEAAPEIKLYQITLESCHSEADYISLLCRFINSHLDWRISGYSHLRAIVASATVTATRMASDAVQSAAVIAASAAQRGAAIAVAVAQQGAALALIATQRGVGMAADAAMTSFRDYRRPPPILAALPPPCSPTRARGGVNQTALPLPRSPSPRSLSVDPRAETIPRCDPDAEIASWIVSPCGTLPAPGFPEPLYSPLPESHTEVFDPRIRLFNSIIAHICRNDFNVFQTQIMSPAFMKIITSLITISQKERGYTYQRLFLPPEMIQVIERYYKDRDRPAPLAAT